MTGAGRGGSGLPPNDGLADTGHHRAALLAELLHLLLLPGEQGAVETARHPRPAFRHHPAATADLQGQMSDNDQWI